MITITDALGKEVEIKDVAMSIEITEGYMGKRSEESLWDDFDRALYRYWKDLNEKLLAIQQRTLNTQDYGKAGEIQS